jgi:hypothetical protein
MAQENLRELLAQLHTRLSNADSLDSESRQLLTTLSHDIERALSRAGAGERRASVDERRASADTAPATEAPAPDRTSLEGIAVQLEAEHPAIANVLRQLVDALGKAGI